MQRMSGRPPASAILLVSVGSLLLSCGRLEFDVDQSVGPVEVQGSLLSSLLPADFLLIPISIDIEQETAQRGTGPASSAHLKSITLEIAMPPGKTFDFLSRLELNVSSEGLPTVRVAHLTPVPGTSRISLQVDSSVDLLPYIKRGARIVTSASGTPPPENRIIVGTVVVTVKV